MTTKSRVEYKPIAWVSEIQLCVLSMALSSTACPSLLLVSCGSNLPDQDGQVLGADLNRSVSGRPLILKGFYSASDCKKCSFFTAAAAQSTCRLCSDENRA
jgi:hypothetical protein